jgi:hypothetical protein
MRSQKRPPASRRGDVPPGFPVVACVVLPGASPGFTDCVRLSPAHIFGTDGAGDVEGGGTDQEEEE